MACRVDKIVQTGVMELPRAVTWEARHYGWASLGGRTGVIRQTVLLPYRLIPLFKSILKSWCWWRSRSLTSWYTWTIAHPWKVERTVLNAKLTPWSRAIPEKLSSSQLLKKLPAFHGIRIHKNPLCLPLSWAIQHHWILPVLSGRSKR